MSLRIQLALPVLLLAAASLIFVGWVWLPQTITFGERQHQEEMQAQLRNMQAALVPLLVGNRLDEIHDQLDALRARNPDWLGLELLDPRGRRLYPLRDDVPLEGAGTRALSMDVQSAGTSLARLVLYFDPSLAARRVEDNAFALLMPFVLLIVAVLVLAWLILDRMVGRPVAALARAADELADGRFDVVLPDLANNEMGRLVGRFGRMRDALARHRSELQHEVEERRRSEDELRQREQFLNTLFETASEGIWIIDRQQRTTGGNRALAELLGCPVEALMGRSIYEFVDDQGQQEFQQRIAQSQGQGQGQRYELQLLRPDGQRVCCQFSSAPLRDEAGAIVGSFALVSDISVRRRYEDRLLELNEALEQRVTEELARSRAKDHLIIEQSRQAAMGDIVHSIAHHWRQPLNALALALANLRDVHELGEDGPGHFEELLLDGERIIAGMSRTIDDFRDFYRPGESARAFAVGEPIDEALLIARPVLEQAGVRTSVTGDMRAQVRGFPRQLSQVLLNLLWNARDALVPRGGGQVWLRVTQAGDEVHIDVADDGGGIDVKIMDRVFEPYFTTRERSSGIGLYMCKVMVERGMHGRIEAGNRNGGAVLTVTLPAAVPVPDGTAMAAS